MGLRPLYIEPHVYRCQILTSKDGPRPRMVNKFDLAYELRMVVAIFNSLIMKTIFKLSGKPN